MFLIFSFLFFSPLRTVSFSLIPLQGKFGRIIEHIHKKKKTYMKIGIVELVYSDDRSDRESTTHCERVISICTNEEGRRSVESMS